MSAIFNTSDVTINGTSMTLEGTTDRFFLPKTPLNTSSGIGISSGTAHFVYLGKTVNTITPKSIRFVATTGGTESSVEVGFFSSPTSPSAANQTLTKLVSGTVTVSLSNGVVTKNTSAFSTAIPGGTFLWAGILATWTVQPVLIGIVGDLNVGMTATLAGSGTFASTTTFSTTNTSCNGTVTNQSVYLVGSLD